MSISILFMAAVSISRIGAALISVSQESPSAGSESLILLKMIAFSVAANACSILASRAKTTVKARYRVDLESEERFLRLVEKAPNYVYPTVLYCPFEQGWSSIAVCL
jgi:hypothetical protein